MRTVPALDLYFPSLAGHADLPDRVSLLLDDLPVSAVLESGEDDRPIWRVFLPDPAAMAASASRLSTCFAAEGLRVSQVSVVDEDWAARSQAGLRRITVGMVTVAPPWDRPDRADGPVVVVHPSMGFGTGHHETTRLCLHLLQQIDLPGRHVLDVGTGSGVLAMAAAALGAADVEAIDVDEDALANARENLAQNGLQARVRLRSADLRSTPLAPGDVVLANLTGALLRSEAAAIAALVRPGGTLVISGFLAADTAAVLEAFAAAFTLQARLEEGDWRAARLRRIGDIEG